SWGTSGECGTATWGSRMIIVETRIKVPTMFASIRTAFAGNDISMTHARIAPPPSNPAKGGTQCLEGEAPAEPGFPARQELLARQEPRPPGLAHDPKTPLDRLRRIWYRSQPQTIGSVSAVISSMRRGVRRL